MLPAQSFSENEELIEVDPQIKDQTKQDVNKKQVSEVNYNCNIYVN